MTISDEVGTKPFAHVRTWHEDPNLGTSELPPHGALGGRLKRAADIVIAGAVLVLLSPLLLIVAIATKLSSSGPVLFGHTRVGFDGQPFRCLKFRSMVTDGDRLLDQYLEANPDEKHAWETERKLKQDPRVTPLGQVLRSTSVDELPQLCNVLAGSMSLVGPRPIVRDELSLYSDAAPFYLSARPGITGLWQVSGRNDVEYDRRVELDKSYVQNWSLGQDFEILLRTIPAVVAGRGSY